MLQIATGMEYLHSQHIMRRDLKSSNLLVSNQIPIDESPSDCRMRVKIADFGKSKAKSEGSRFTTMDSGTRRWMAPEVFDVTGAKYKKNADVYSFAMVCYEILSGNIPFDDGGRLSQLYQRLLNGERPKLPTSCPPYLANYIEKCWQWDPEKRPSFVQISRTFRYLKGILLSSANPLTSSPLSAEHLTLIEDHLEQTIGDNWPSTASGGFITQLTFGMSKYKEMERKLTKQEMGETERKLTKQEMVAEESKHYCEEDGAYEEVAEEWEHYCEEDGAYEEVGGQEYVIQKAVTYLKTRSDDIMAICLHGMVGIGKSFLGLKIFTEFQKSKYRDCRVDLQLETKQVELCDIQKQIVETVCKHPTSKFSSPIDGRQNIEKELKQINDPIFLYVDNVLEHHYLIELLPMAKVFPKGSRILITSRGDDIGRRGISELGITNYELIEVRKLQKQQAQQLLWEQLESKGEHRVVNEVESFEERVLELCDGLPLALTVVGKYIADNGASPWVWGEVVKDMQKAERFMFSIQNMIQISRGHNFSL